MSEEITPPAIKAVMHILRRVQTSPDFAHYMLATESFALCVRAAADHLGEPEETLRQKIEKNAANLRHEPEVVGLRNVVEQLERLSDKEVGEIIEFDEEWQNSRIDAVEELLRFAELGVERLTVETLRVALAGNAMAIYRNGAT